MPNNDISRIHRAGPYALYKQIVNGESKFKVISGLAGILFVTTSLQEAEADFDSRVSLHFSP